MTSWPLTPRDADVPAWDDVAHKDWQVERMAVYAAMIERMDQGVGRLDRPAARNRGGSRTR